MSKLEKAMDKVLDVFKKGPEEAKEANAAKVKKTKMTKKQMKALLHKELEQWRLKCKNKKVFENILAELNTNEEEHVDFRVFVNYVARLMMCSDCYFCE